MQSELATMTASLADYASTNDNLQGRWEQSEANLRQQIEARRDAEQAQAAAEQGQRDAASARADAENTIANLEREVTSLTDAKGQLEIDLQALIEYTGVSVAEIANMPLIDGAVLAINTSVAPGLVSINKGTADGVKRGFTFEVYQGGTFLAVLQPGVRTGNLAIH